MEITDDNMNLTPDDSESERDLRLRNQLKRMELAAKYGADFGDGNSQAPPNVEAQWLDYIEQFEEQFRKGKRTTVRAFVGNPAFKALADIPPELLEDELDQVLEFLACYNVVVDFLCDVPPQEAYRFVTEELLDEETEDIRIDGMNHHFIYEEFHPNDEYDAKRDAEGFLRGIFWLKADMFSHYLTKKGLRDVNNRPLGRKRLLKSLTDFRSSFLSLEQPEVTIESCQLDGDRATVAGVIEWSGVVDEQSPPVRRSGNYRLELTRSPYGGWDVGRILLPGWNQA